jgi:hypothetical protein
MQPQYLKFSNLSFSTIENESTLEDDGVSSNVQASLPKVYHEPSYNFRIIYWKMPVHDIRYETTQFQQLYFQSKLRDASIKSLLALNIIITSSLLIARNPYFIVLSLVTFPYLMRQASHYLTMKLAIQRLKNDDKRRE